MKGGLRALWISMALLNQECPQLVTLCRCLDGIHFVVINTNYLAFFDNENLAFVFTRLRFLILQIPAKVFLEID